RTILTFASQVLQDAPVPWPPIENDTTYWTRDYSLVDWTRTQFGGQLPVFTPQGATRVQLAGTPFAIGPDGFVYDMMGRPHLVDAKGELVPLPKLNYYFLVRRLAQAKDPN